MYVHGVEREGLGGEIYKNDNVRERGAEYRHMVRPTTFLTHSPPSRASLSSRSHSDKRKNTESCVCDKLRTHPCVESYENSAMSDARLFQICTRERV